MVVQYDFKKDFWDHQDLFENRVSIVISKIIHCSKGTGARNGVSGSQGPYWEELYHSLQRIILSA